MSASGNPLRRYPSMVLEIGMSMATFFSELLLIFFGGNRIRYVFATSSVVFSAATVCGVVRSYVSRGSCSCSCENGVKRSGCCYFFSRNNRHVWHSPVPTESVRFLYSALALVTTLIDFIRIAVGKRVIQGFTAFPAAFASLVFVLAAIDHVVLYTTDNN